jgi:hypothetical protein
MKKAFVLSVVILAAAVLTQVAPAEAVTVTLANIDLGEADIVELYVSYPNSENWGDDMLGDDVLSHRDEFKVNVRGSAFDLRVVWEDGSDREYYGIPAVSTPITLANDDDFGIMVMRQ